MKEIKISKLFHLLYATLLLAPVFAVGVSCAQTAFTGNGFVAETEEVYTEGTSVSQDSFKPNTWYIVDTTLTSNDWGTMNFYMVDLLYIEGTDPEIKPVYIQNFWNLYFSYDATSQGMKFHLENWSPSMEASTGFYYVPLLAFRYKDSTEVQGSFNLPVKTDSSDFFRALPVIGEEKGYQDVFYTSVDKVAQSPFFNWAEKSFIGDGFRYMGNIFGMPTDNPFYTFTCYWCAISILWLIFDVVMYVPKLAHRWLDKGAIE